jgi:hypothetical protein
MEVIFFSIRARIKKKKKKKKKKKYIKIFLVFLKAL